MVFPASGCEMMANVRRRDISFVLLIYKVCLMLVHYSLDAVMQAILPIGNFNVICFLDFCFVEYAVAGPMSRSGVVGTAAWQHTAAGDARDTMNGLGEIIPRDGPLVTVMVDAVFPFLGLSDGDNGRR